MDWEIDVSGPGVCGLAGVVSVGRLTNLGKMMTTPMAPMATTANARNNHTFERLYPAFCEIEGGTEGGVRSGLAFAGGGVSTGLRGFCSTYRIPRKLKLFHLHFALIGNNRNGISRLVLDWIDGLYFGGDGRL